ncbi:MAG: hypothetical protein MUF54_21550, partial [Polyangiaceae bacterium]|nr:hypothetical protein [Polyangiaceae bacterium]
MNRSIRFLTALVAVSPLACASNVGHQAEQAGTSQQALTACTDDVLEPGDPGQCRGAWRYHKLSCNEMRTCNPGETCACEHERAWARADGEYMLRTLEPPAKIVVGWGGTRACGASVHDYDWNNCEWVEDYGVAELCKPIERCVQWGRDWRMITPTLDEQARQAAAELQKAIAAKEGMDLPRQTIVEYKASLVRGSAQGAPFGGNPTIEDEYRVDFDVPYTQELPCRERDLGRCTLEPAAYSLVGARRDQLGVPSEEELDAAYRIVPAGGGPARALAPSELPLCTTYDNLPVDTAQGVRDKFDALDGMVQELNATFRGDEAARKEVLLPVLRELTTLLLVKSADLDAARMLLVTRLVHETQDLLLGAPAAALQEGGANCGDPDAIVEQLLSGPQAATGEAQSAEEAKLRLELLLNVVERPYPSDGTERREELKHRLELIGQWWSHAPNAPDSDEPEGAGDVMKAIYDGVYGPGLRRLDDAALANRYEVYQELLGGNLEPVRELLALLYPSPGPLP